MTAKFPKAFAAAGLAAVLVGCGGGSETARMEPPMEEEPGPSMEDNQRMAITSAIDASEAAIGQVTTTASKEAVDEADTALAALKTAIDMATALSETELAAHEATYKAHDTLLKSNKAARTAYNQEKERMRMAAEKKTRDDAAKLWITAIDDYDVGTVAQLDDDLRGTQDLDVDIENGSAVITLNDDENGLPISSTNSQAPAAGWTAKRFTETAERSRGVIVTNRVAPEDETVRQGFIRFFFTTADGGATYAPTATPVITGVTGAVNNDNQPTRVITIASAATTEVEDSHFTGTIPTNINGSENASVTFLGIPGTITCGNDACTKTYIAGTEGLFHFGNDATFTPRETDVDDLVVARIVTDLNAEHLAFGYWLTTTGSGTSLRHSIDTYAEGFGYGANNPIPAASNLVNDATNGLLGSASYSGGAAGVYVYKKGELPDNPDLYDGEFVADVALTAQFGDNRQGRIALADQWKITGTINGFKSVTSSTDHDLSGWELGLEADFGARAAATGVIATPNLTLTNAETEGGSTEGTWIAAFYGALPVAGAGTAAADNTIEAIVGEFDGHFIDGHVVGAFGAEIDD